MIPKRDVVRRFCIAIEKCKNDATNI